MVQSLLADIERIPKYYYYGRVTAVLGMLVEVGGTEHRLSIGDRCHLSGRSGARVSCEVVGFRAGRALLMPFASLEGVGIGCKAQFLCFCLLNTSVSFIWVMLCYDSK